VTPSTSVLRDLHSGYQGASDRSTVIAAMTTCGPQLVRSCPAALDGWLAALSLSKGDREALAWRADHFLINLNRPKSISAITTTTRISGIPIEPNI
jgi:hypothetical protein